MQVNTKTWTTGVPVAFLLGGTFVGGALYCAGRWAPMPVEKRRQYFNLQAVACAALAGAVAATGVKVAINLMQNR